MPNKSLAASNGHQGSTKRTDLLSMLRFIIMSDYIFVAVVEGRNRLYRTELASIKHAYKTEYSIHGKDDHVRVQSVHEA